MFNFRQHVSKSFYMSPDTRYTPDTCCRQHVSGNMSPVCIPGFIKIIMHRLTKTQNEIIYFSETEYINNCCMRAQYSTLKKAWILAMCISLFSKLSHTYLMYQWASRIKQNRSLKNAHDHNPPPCIYRRYDYERANEGIYRVGQKNTAYRTHGNNFVNS